VTGARSPSPEPGYRAAGNGPVRVAEAGIRGIPANFGGSETAVEEIGRRLAERGYEVTVYCRRHNSTTDAPEYLGMRRILLPSFGGFNFDTITHSAIASLDVLLRNTADVVHFHGVGNALVLPLFRLSRKRVVITVDGPDWERPKWGPIARRMLKLSARIAARWADELIIDNRPSIEYFRERFGVEGTYIAYGADRDPPTDTDHLESLGLQPRGYVLFVGALVPDKGPDVLIEAYRRIDTDRPLVIVGDSPFAASYRRALQEVAARDPRIRMLGYTYGEPYRQLLAHAYAYAHPLRSDGTSPALLQAMGYGSCIVVNSLPEALSAVGDAAVPYQRDDPADLARKLELILSNADLAQELRERARRRAVREYDWDAVATAHAAVYASQSLASAHGDLPRDGSGPQLTDS
jgi:glycosyltransferase involved in cell wall biosynthesis